MAAVSKTKRDSEESPTLVVDGKVFFLDQKFENAIFFGTWISSFFLTFTSRNGLHLRTHERTI